MKILVIGQYRWGKGETEEEAEAKSPAIWRQRRNEAIRRLRGLGRDLGGRHGRLCRNHDSPWPRLLTGIGRKVEIMT